MVQNAHYRVLSILLSTTEQPIVYGESSLHFVTLMMRRVQKTSPPKSVYSANTLSVLFTSVSEIKPVPVIAEAFHCTVPLNAKTQTNHCHHDLTHDERLTEWLRCCVQIVLHLQDSLPNHYQFHILQTQKVSLTQDVCCMYLALV